MVVWRTLLVLAIAAGVYLLPAGDTSRLAARESAALMSLAPEGRDVSFGRLILEGPHGYEREGATMRFALAGARLDGVPIESPAHFELRRSIVQGLRAEAAGLERDDGGTGYSLVIPGQDLPVTRGASFLGGYSDGELWLEYQPRDDEPVRVSEPWSPPDNLSLLPPVAAIALAILLRRPLVALFFGVLTGAFLVQRTSGAGVFEAAGAGTLDVFRKYFWAQLVDPERMMIIVFVVLMLATVGVITRNGGIRGLMERIATLASSARRTQVATYVMGLVIFFDDYANTILVGSTMRPLTDRFRVAREKLAYIVDSTAAPVAGISIFSTWIAFEVSTFSAQLPSAGLTAADGYSVFLQTLPYRFYCILTLVLVAFVTLSGRDFGPMLTAERRARATGALVRPGGQPMVGEDATHLEPAEGARPAAFRAILPILTFIVVTLVDILRRGGAFAMPSGELFSIEGMTGVLYDGSGSAPLMVGSAAGLVVAFALSALQGLTGAVADAALRTLKSMGVAIAILYLAWMIGAVCQDDLGTAAYLSELVGDAIHPALLPMLLFVLSGAVAFSTGSSWSTMSILLPLVVGLSYSMGQTSSEVAHLGGHGLMILSIGAVLEGAIFGDHCSPISDTTVMSSIAAASDHIDHVRTQAPYAVLSMVVAMAVGYFPCAFVEGFSPYYSWGLGIAALALFLALRGKRADVGVADD